MDPFTAKVEKAILEHRMLDPGDRVVVACSGGPDSVALLGSLRELVPGWRLELAAAHLNHSLRGPDSDADEAWVRELTDRLGCPLVVEKLAEPPSGSLEEWARRKRYEFLVRAADEFGAAVIALGHQRGDAAETVLMNLVRGAGLDGLAGIPRVSHSPLTPGKRLIRPLLGLAREEIRDYLGRQGLGFREDLSNLDLRFLRNRVRHELMPLLKSLNPGIEEALVRTAQVAREQSELVRSLAREWLERGARKEAGQVVMDLAALSDAGPGLRLAVYREAIREAAGTLHGFGFVHLAALDRLAMTGPAHGRLDLPGLTVRREYDRLFLESTLRVDPEFAAGSHGPVLSRAGQAAVPESLSRVEVPEVLLPVPGQVTWKGPGAKEYVITSEYGSYDGRAEDFRDRVWLDPGQVRLPLAVRARGPGDRFRPLGMTGTRKLKEIMNELKISPRDRDLWPLVVDGEGIIWMPGYRPAERVRPAGPLARALAVSVRPRLLTTNHCYAQRAGNSRGLDQ